MRPALRLSDHVVDDKLPALGIFTADIFAVIESATDGVAETDDGTKWKL